jgi:hypothetical protein
MTNEQKYKRSRDFTAAEISKFMSPKLTKREKALFSLGHQYGIAYTIELQKESFEQMTKKFKRKE